MGSSRDISIGSAEYRRLAFTPAVFAEITQMTLGFSRVFTHNGSFIKNFNLLNFSPEFLMAQDSYGVMVLFLFIIFHKKGQNQAFRNGLLRLLQMRLFRHLR
ncbi:hypothetical protein SOVF_108710 isoform A [Spinacia oleracea]|nr:hypothetical protein SOVF_108710 isoform A [Spinacia oleracea]